jgi:dihydroflavonol-4-reductase
LTVFVTGGSGFVGGAVIDHLVASGVAVKALARSQAAADAVRDRGAAVIRGDLSDAAAMQAGMRGADVVYHVAGVNKMCAGDPGPMYRTNVDRVRSVVRASVAAGVRRIVLTSSAAVIGEADGVVADEETPHAGRFLSHYARSKYLGERAFFDEAERFGIEAVAVNPSSVQGPGRSDGSAKLLRYALGVPRPVAIETTLSVVDIDDTARAHLRAAEHGIDGERYLVNGATADIRGFVALLAGAAGRNVDPIILPRWAAAGLYPVAAIAGAAMGDAPVCVEMLRTLLHGHRFDASRSIDELGMTYTPLADTLDRAVRWLAENGFISL